MSWRLKQPAAACQGRSWGGLGGTTVGCVGETEAQSCPCWAGQPWAVPVAGQSGCGVTVPQCLCRCGPAVEL